MGERINTLDGIEKQLLSTVPDAKDRAAQRQIEYNELNLNNLIRSLGYTLDVVIDVHKCYVDSDKTLMKTNSEGTYVTDRLLVKGIIQSMRNTCYAEWARAVKRDDLFCHMHFKDLSHMLWEKDLKAEQYAE